ncbi:hypothetical protein TSAR_014836 [Trichomalopsis sarcophagae]|uniref:Uncharacterized protein n=1 Tax=Trichomalopsis sarcophagae TaxID=543379 RepID=A0A232FLV5_9HYME|nr:hypothetical protein TSAR_014836 [Trichomalopsis sarcophagae]
MLPLQSVAGVISDVAFFTRSPRWNRSRASRSFVLLVVYTYACVCVRERARERCGGTSWDDSSSRLLS